MSTVRRRGRAVVATLCVTIAMALATPAPAALPPEVGTSPTSTVLSVPAHAHWVWINDPSFDHMIDGRAHLIDGDTGRYLGVLSTGYSYTHLVLARDGKLIYSPEIYFSRGTRGTRTDVVTIYDAATLKVVDEVPIPPKRVSDIPTTGNAGLTDDDRFLVIYNFTPSQSVSVVDTASRKFVGEIETPGCALAFPSGARTFFAMCADGSLLSVELDDTGRAQSQSRTAPLFDVAHDPVAERPVRVGDTWYFVSYDGRIHPVRRTADGYSADASWPLTTAAERTQGWRPGGLQQIAVHAGQNRLYVIMHQGGRDTHKDPGRSIWVYDLKSHHRVQQVATRHPTGSIKLSGDDHPLLFTIFEASSELDVYDGRTGRFLRTVTEAASSPMLLVTP